MKKTFNAFTMAEILISLTIIGIIAALTLPSLMVNINEKVWNTQRKALHARLSQALGSMTRLNGFAAADGHSAAYNFIQDGLGTALNITKVCDGVAGMGKCDFPAGASSVIKIQNEETFDPAELMAADSTLDRFSTDTAVFNTVNGDSIVVVYNRNCTGSTKRDFLTKAPQELMCATFLYDLNGAAKGPNKMGKDMGVIGAFFPEYPTVVAPMPATATTAATSFADAESIGANADYRLPTAPEAYMLSKWFMNDDSIVDVWSDDNILCHKAAMCGTSGTGYAIPVTKTGDAPQTWADAKTAEQTCTDNGGSWSDTTSTCTPGV